MDRGVELSEESPPGLVAARRQRQMWSRVASMTGRADLHVHSLWSDGAQRPDAIVRAAAGRVNVVAITDHDEIRGAQDARAYALDHPPLGVDVVVGEEISTLNGHLLGLYLSERVPGGLSARESIGLIHDQGGLAVAAHPFHPLRGTARGQLAAEPSRATVRSGFPHLRCLHGPRPRLTSPSTLRPARLRAQLL